MFLIRHLFLFLCIQYDSKFVNTLFWFDNDFEIESKYHRKIVVLCYSSYLEFTRCYSSEYVFSCKSHNTDRFIQGLEGGDSPPFADRIFTT
jgi:hypothetical protein